MRIPKSAFSAAVVTSAAVVCLGMGACGQKAVSPPLSEGFRLDDPEKTALTILKVEDISFTNADFVRFVHLTVGEAETNLNAEAAGRLFDDFINRKLIVRRAAAEGVGLTVEEKSESLAVYRMNQSGENAPSDEAAQEDFLEGVLVEKYLGLQVRDVVIGEDEVTAYYDTNKNEYFQPERLQVSQILLSAEGKASEVLNKLRYAGEREFREIAKTESAGPEADKGGLMGIFSLGQLPMELEKVIFALQEGRISRVVQSAYGYHIFRLDKKFESRLMPRDEAAPLIRAKLTEQKNQTAVDALIASLKQSMRWEISAKNLPFLYEVEKSE